MVQSEDNAGLAQPQLGACSGATSVLDIMPCHPGKEGEAEAGVNWGLIKSMQTLIQLHSDGIMSMQRACDRDQSLRKVRILDSTETLAVGQLQRIPWRGTDLGKTSFVTCNRRNTDARIFEIHKWADNPSAERDGSTIVHAPLFRLARMERGRGKKGPHEFKSKKARIPVKSHSNCGLHGYPKLLTGHQCVSCRILNRSELCYLKSEAGVGCKT